MITKNRKLVAGAAAAAVMTAGFTVAPTAGTSASHRGYGTARTNAVLVEVRAAGILTKLGTTALMATNDPAVRAAGPLATTDVELAEISGAPHGQQSARSDGTTALTGLDISETTTAGPIRVNTDQLSAAADDEAATATAILQQLDVTLSVLDGLDLDVAASGVSSSVSPTSAVATHTIAVGQIEITLGTLLGSALDGLPLADLAALATVLDVALPAGLAAPDDLLAAVTAVRDAVTDLESAAAAVAAATAALSDADVAAPLAGFGDMDAYTAYLATLAGLDLIGDPAGSLTALLDIADDAQIVALGCALTVPTALNLAAVAAELTTCVGDHQAAYAAAVAALADEAAAVVTAADAYATSVAAAVAAASDLATASTDVATLLTEVVTLVANLGEAPLLSLDTLVVAQRAQAVGANLAGSSATTSCTGASLTVAGLPSVDIVDCNTSSADILAAIAAFPTMVNQVLDTVGAISTATDAHFSLLGSVESVEQDTAGRVTATSTSEVLSLTIPDVTIDVCGVVDDIVCGLGVDLRLPIAAATLDLGPAVSAAHGLADAALGGVATLLAATGVAPDVAGEAGASGTIMSALTTLESVVDGFTLGELGLATGTLLRGVEVVVDPVVTATHAPRPDADPAPEPDPDPTPDDISDPTPDAPEPASVPDPVTPEPDVTADPSSVDDPSETAGPSADPDADPAPAPPEGNLPNTGGGAALVALAALGGGVALRRRRD